jgi:hypothetical protein
LSFPLFRCTLQVRSINAGQKALDLRHHTRAFTHCRRDTPGRPQANIAIGGIPSTLVCNDIDSIFAS